MGGESSLANKRHILQADEEGSSVGPAAAACEVAVDFSKWLEGRGSLSRHQKPSFSLPYRQNVSFEVPIPSLPGAAWLWLRLLVFPQTRLPDILPCCSMWQRDFILFTLEEQHISCSCQAQLPTHKKEGKRQRALPVCFPFCPVLLCYCFSQCIAWVVP